VCLCVRERETSGGWGGRESARMGGAGETKSWRKSERGREKVEGGDGVRERRRTRKRVSERDFAGMCVKERERQRDGERATER